MGETGAFCLLLWSHRGKQKGPRGRSGGYCDDPTDCYRCPLLQREISLHPLGHANWICPACLPEIIRKNKQTGKPRILLTGHYSEGQCQYFLCSRLPRLEYRDVSIEEAVLDRDVKWTDADIIELPRGYSRFLQLVIGDITEET